MTDAGILVLVAFTSGFALGLGLTSFWAATKFAKFADTGRFAGTFEAEVVPPPPDTEDRILASAELDLPPVTDGMIEKGTQDLLALARRAGMNLSEEDARRQAEMMLNGMTPE